MTSQVDGENPNFFMIATEAGGKFSSGDTCFDGKKGLLSLWSNVFSLPVVFLEVWRHLPKVTWTT